VTQAIKGYRDLTADEIELVNEIKTTANDLDELIVTMTNLPNIDQRWVAIAKTDLQKGFMSLVRAVTRPTGF